jgi:hypothetical protein
VPDGFPSSNILLQTAKHLLTPASADFASLTSMSCRIKYAVHDGLLRAEVSGRSAGADAAWIARNIVEQAIQLMVSRLLIDVRRLQNRLGTLGTLAMVTSSARAVSGYRVAVVDVMEYDGYYAWHEQTAQQRGFALRCFTSAAEAVNWLRCA